MIVPLDFQEEVARAHAARRSGDLRLLAEEARSFAWGADAVRLIDDAQLQSAASSGEVQRSAAATPVFARAVLFTGHMLDAPDRPPAVARFPRTLAAETMARTMIETALRKELVDDGGPSLGIAGGACGSDILFHEVCLSLGVATELFLALPTQAFEAESVNRGGPVWIERFRRIVDRVPVRVLMRSKQLPAWLAFKRDYDIWRRCNLWMMFNALATQATHHTLLALYDREQKEDGPGGAGHLVHEAAQRGFKMVELDARKLTTVG